MIVEVEISILDYVRNKSRRESKVFCGLGRVMVVSRFGTGV